MLLTNIKSAYLQGLWLEQYVYSSAFVLTMRFYSSLLTSFSQELLLPLLTLSVPFTSIENEIRSTQEHAIAVVAPVMRNR